MLIRQDVRLLQVSYATRLGADAAHRLLAAESALFPEYTGNFDGKSQNDAYDGFIQREGQRCGCSDSASLRGESRMGYGVRWAGLLIPGVNSRNTPIALSPMYLRTGNRTPCSATFR